MFELDKWVIDTKKEDAVTVVARLDGIGELYVLKDDDGECYIADAERLIPYDKQWFDRKAEG